LTVAVVLQALSIIAPAAVDPALCVDLDERDPGRVAAPADQAAPGRPERLAGRGLACGLETDIADAVAGRLQGRRGQEGPAALNATGWGRAFDDPIILPDGRKLASLRDAIAFLAKMPKARHNDPDVQNAARCITWAAESGGILMLAEIAMRKVLNAVGPRA